jgi:LPS sulfotransferase NodH
MSTLARDSALSLGVLLCATPRTGSYLLCDLIQQVNLGRPHEIARPEDRSLWADALGYRDYRDYSQDLFHRYSAEGVFAAKCMWFQFSQLNRIAREKGSLSFETHRCWERLVDRAHYVRLVRSDVVDQLVSWLRAQKNGVYNVRNNDEVHINDDYSDECIRRSIKFFESELQGWEAFFSFHRITYLTIRSEHLFSRPELVIKSILAFVGRTDGVEPVIRTSPINWKSDVSESELQSRVRRLIQLHSPFLALHTRG